MRKLTLLLVRHGETTWNKEGRLQGWQNVPLSPAGGKQAERLAARLARLWDAARAGNNTGFVPGPPRAFYASDLDRAVDTARIIAEAVRGENTNAAPVHQLPGLRERHLGEREGLTAGEAQAKWGSLAPLDETGETYVQVNERMEAVLQNLWDTHAAPEGESGKAVLAAGHGGSLRLWLCRAAHLEMEHVRRFHLDNTSLSVVTFTGADLAGSEGRILLCNDTAHLQAE